MQPVFNGSKGLYSAVARLAYQPLITKPTVTLTKSSTGIKANWNAVSGATKYIVYFRKSGDAWSSSEVTATSAEYKNLTKGNQYLVQVQPVIGSKKGDYSKVASITF